MPRDPFAVLGLAPGTYGSAEIERRYQSARRPLLTQLADADDAWAARRRLDDLHWAYRTLIQPENQVRAARMLNGEGDKSESLRLYIEASLEDGLLRASRRQEILELGSALGLSEFHTHLMIAQTQFGCEPVQISAGVKHDDAIRMSLGRLRSTTYQARRNSIGIRAVCAMALAGAMFCLMLRWVG